MTTFLTTIADDLERCRHSLRQREPISIRAAVGGAIRTMNGVVSAIEPVRDSIAPVWKISIDEAPPSSQALS
jgi:hypothetical protein